MNTNISRRHFLRGVGVGVALPAFASIRTGSLLAAETPAAAKLAVTPTGAPLRTAFVYFPNGAIPAAWWPSGTPGPDFKWSRTLAPLEPHKQSIQILSGLDHHTAEAGPDGGGDHARANGTFLTGHRLKKSATDIHAGISIDQVLAREIGKATRFPSLELASDSISKGTGCDSGYACAYQFNISWSSPTAPKAAETNPRQAFERLFGDGKPGERLANAARRRNEEQSVLDFVLDDAKSMQSRLDPHDRRKLDQYLTGLRELETRIQKAEKFGDAGKDPGVDTPPGIPIEYADYVQLMYDILVLSFQTDSTRVATFMLAHDGSNRSFEQIGVVEGHHDISHHFNKKELIEKVQDIDLWYVRQFAEFLKKLDAVKDADGKSVLYNSQILYGSGNADGNRHTHTNLPAILAGAAGGALKPGRYVKFGGKPMCNMFVGMAHRTGAAAVTKFGDSTGAIESF
ncbi:MAG TPA: DUF1552 domain-containing protein [Fimbriiglobus sp.]|jgi:hypothetical protein